MDSRRPFSTWGLLQVGSGANGMKDLIARVQLDNSWGAATPPLSLRPPAQPVVRQYYDLCSLQVYLHSTGTKQSCRAVLFWGGSGSGYFFPKPTPDDIALKNIFGKVLVPVIP